MKYLYSIKRKVVEGNKIARTFGYPTANFRYYKRDNKLENGVYVIRLKITKNYFQGLAFIGKPKTIEADKRIEIFILKFRGNLYNKIIKVKFLKRIRGVKKFKDVKDLKLEIQEDIKKAKKFFKC